MRAMVIVLQLLPLPSPGVATGQAANAVTPVGLRVEVLRVGPDGTETLSSEEARVLPGKGAFFFGVSALACIILFPVSVVVPALVALAVLDSVTTLAGIRFGRHRIHNGKSWEGSLSGIAVTVLCLLPFLSLPGAVMASVCAGIIELYSPVDDNLVIPVGVCLLLVLVPSLV